MFGFLVASFSTVCVALSLLTNMAWTAPLVRRLGTGIAPPYIAAVSVLLALLTGFVANDAWERQRLAGRVVQAERAHALTIHDLSIASAPDMSRLRAALRAYLEAVIDDEWPMMADTGAASPAAGEALSRLLQTASDPRMADEAGQVVHVALLDTAMQLRSARSERLALSAARSDESKWVTLMVLAVLTLTTIGLVHWERPYAQATTLAIFSAAMITTLGVIAIHERPFDGPLALKADPLKAAHAVMVAHARAKPPPPAAAASPAELRTVEP
ncbi:DUF4239 domain-containing protein [Methylobacterium durans]|uniref:DUF4239 domain-containing protein n=1 Tax=Methylobacterium durans TaxID=2202825 RepID=A0A2U8W314_9HYPH|nr:DUF4239 domain-containing protein [Methylobacterium durans]AWN40493.1 hypothetical protein DK389_08065 [Methylobacterium durans]